MLRTLSCRNRGLILCGSRFYFSAPVPSLVLGDVQGLLQTHAGLNLRGSHGFGGPRLTPRESFALGLARRSGVLLLTSEAASQQLCNAFYVHCWSSALPYVAVNRHGVIVCCDLSPLAGLGRSAALVSAGEARLSAALQVAGRALAVVQAARPGLQLVNASTLKAQASALLPGPTEGSNSHRTPDVSPDKQFTVFAPSRHAAQEAALALAKALGAPPQGAGEARRQDLEMARKERLRARLLRRLTKLADDPIAVKNLRVPAGAIDGFAKARSAGLIREPAPLR